MCKRDYDQAECRSRLSWKRTYNFVRPARTATYQCGSLDGSCRHAATCLDVQDVGIKEMSLTLSQREVYRRLPWFMAEHAGSHPAFPPGSAAAVPSKRSTGDFINYSDEDNKAIERYITDNIATAYHTVSTCPLRQREKGGVVDPALNVYGVKGLKIAGESGLEWADGRYLGSA